jgi:hypothetical protein
MLDVRKYLLHEFNRSMRRIYCHPGVVGMWYLICVHKFFLLIICTQWCLSCALFYLRARLVECI